MGFLNSIFLVGFITAAIPIIIHLLNRRRVRKIKISSLEFLAEVNRRRMRQLNLRRLIILALRTLAVLLLVIAFARPTLRAAGLFLPGKAPKNVIICLDASYSMGVEQEEGSAFTAAARIADEIVDESGKNDAINLILFADRAEPQFEMGTRSKSLVKSAIAEASVTGEGTSIGRAVARALELIETSDVAGGEIYVVSDFRYNSDSTVTDGMKRDDVRIFYVPVYEDAIDNVSIDQVMVPRKLLRPGEVIKIAVALTNHSATGAASFSIELTVEGSRKAEKVVRLAPSSSSTVTFPISFVQWGSYRCKVSKNPDRLPIDDERHFMLEVSHSVPVTLVRGKRVIGNPDDARAAGYFYLEKALNPTGGSDGEFVVRTIDEDNVTAATLPARGVVVWVDPQRLESNRLSLLQRFVNRGGGLMVFIGGSNRRLLESRTFRNFIGMRAAVERTSEAQTGYTSFKKDHPVFSIFNEEELQLLSRARVRSYLSARGVAPDSVLAYIGGGDPAVWECARGRGRILVFAAAPDLESGDVPLSPMFLPLIHTSASYLASAGRGETHRENPVGRQLYFETPQSVPAVSRLVIRDPAGVPIKPVVFEDAQGDLRVICERPEKVGVYQLQQDTTVVSEMAVNVATEESNLTVSSMPDRGGAAAGVVHAGENFIDELQAMRQGREVFALFILLAMAALVAESILGRKG